MSDLFPGEIKFIESHRPSIGAGEYEVRLDQKLSGAGIDGESAFSLDARFFVEGDRFAVPPEMVRVRFPPAGSVGDHSDVLPHVVLKRSTLPWERSAESGRDDRPWLALLVFHDDEAPAVVVTPESLQRSFAGCVWDELLREDVGWLEASSLPGVARAARPRSGAAPARLAPPLGAAVGAALDDLAAAEDGDVDIVSFAEALADDAALQAWDAFVAAGWIAPIDGDRSASLVAEADRVASLATTVGEIAGSVVERLRSPRTLDLVGRMSGAVKWPGVEFETLRDRSTSTSVIDVEADVLRVVLPAPRELPLLAHVREVTHPTRHEHAVLLANRLPVRPGLTTVHLVSLEERLADGAFADQGAVTGEFVRLISLASWSFTCRDRSRTFVELARGLDGGRAEGGRLPGLRVPSPTAAGTPYAEVGAVPLPHVLRTGEKTVSWYGGPLSPAAAWEEWGPQIAGPVIRDADTSDQLLRFDEKLGMLDTSWASAFEVGRLLGLRDKKWSLALFDWKRRRGQARQQTERRGGRDHLPFRALREPGADEVTAELEKTIRARLDRLILLEEVPFNYLVPDERMLPLESIRFFALDQVWMSCLMHGAMSIGRVHAPDPALDAEITKMIDDLCRARRTGVLLRSELVSGWTDLTIDAYDLREGEPAKVRLPLAASRRLSDSVLLCLFDGEVDFVNVHLEPEALHFGFREGAASELVKRRRRPDGTIDAADVIAIDDPLWRSKDDRVLALRALCNRLAPSEGAPSTSEDLAYQMIERVDNVSLPLK